MNMINGIIEWVRENPIVATAIIIYLLANFAPRPHPENQKGWVKVLWQIVDRLCVLTTSKIPGRLKLLLLDSPKPSKTSSEAAADPAEEKEKKGAPNE